MPVTSARLSFLAQLSQEVEAYEATRRGDTTSIGIGAGVLAVVAWHARISGQERGHLRGRLSGHTL